MQGPTEQAATVAGIVPWPQNVLRHSFCSHAAEFPGFEWTASQADHSVKMLRSTYWRKVTKPQGAQYFATAPAAAYPALELVVA